MKKTSSITSRKSLGSKLSPARAMLVMGGEALKI